MLLLPLFSFFLGHAVLRLVVVALAPMAERIVRAFDAYYEDADYGARGELDGDKVAGVPVLLVTLELIAERLVRHSLHRTQWSHRGQIGVVAIGV